ncbi:MAG: glycosyltransferase [Thermodesulforhabdaceae bacterium]
MSAVEISCCMIVKNEEAHIKGCLQSLIHEVDEIVVVDTGSTDKTKEIVTSFGPKVRIIEFPWRDDFAEARNVSLREAKGSWVLTIDADERLNPLGRKNIIRELIKVKGVDAYSVRIRSFHLDNDKISGSFDWAVRLFKKLPDVEFSGIIHESVFPSLLKRGSIIKQAPFIIDHFGYEVSQDKLRLKLERNFKLALKQIRKTPKDPYFLYHLALPAFQLGRHRTALRVIDKAHQIIKQSKNITDKHLHCFILNLKSRILLEKGNYQEAIELAENSLSLIPQQRSARIIKGVAYTILHKWDEAIPWLEEAFYFQNLAGDPLKDPSSLSMELTIPSRDIKNLLARCYANTGQHQKAIAMISDENAEILPVLATIAMDKGDIEGAIAYLANLDHHKLTFPTEHILKSFERILSKASDTSSHVVQGINKFLKLLGLRPDWRKTLSPFVDIIVSQKKSSWFFRLVEKDDPNDLSNKRLGMLLAIKSGNIDEAIGQSLYQVKSILSKPEISPEEQEILKLHVGLLIYAGKKREASSLVRMVERIKGVKL